MTNEEHMDEMHAGYIELVRKAGHPVHMDSKFCNDRRNEKGDECRGCESEHGCSRVCALMQSMSQIQAQVRDKPALIPGARRALQKIQEEILLNGLLEDNTKITVKKGDRI